MSLQYIIDGYNITNHPRFLQQINKKEIDRRAALLGLIRRKRLTGSPKNRVIIVFDGYPDASLNAELSKDSSGISVIFSRKQTADERIKKAVEGAANPKTIVVVSDDKEIKLTARYLGAHVLSVEEFMPQEKRLRDGKNKDEELKTDLSYTQIDRINKELKDLWLK